MDWGICAVRGAAIDRVGNQGGSRMATQLKLYVPPEGETEPRPEPEILMKLGDFLPIISVAHRLNFAWLRDFLDDEIAVSGDLYEVMQSFSRRKPTRA
jgi:hypothetical protein